LHSSSNILGICRHNSQAQEKGNNSRQRHLHPPEAKRQPWSLSRRAGRWQTVNQLGAHVMKVRLLKKRQVFAYNSDSGSAFRREAIIGDPAKYSRAVADEDS
jgi:hypothetical protein